VADLIVTDNTKDKRNNRRCSSKIFSLAKIGRMNSMYKYEDAQDFSWDKMFTIENPEYVKACGILGAKAVQPTQEM